MQAFQSEQQGTQPSIFTGTPAPEPAVSVVDRGYRNPENGFYTYLYTPMNGEMRP